MTPTDVQEFKAEVARILAEQQPRQFVMTGGLNEYEKYIRELVRQKHDVSGYVLFQNGDQVEHLHPPMFAGFVLVGTFYNNPYYNSKAYLRKTDEAAKYWSARIDESLDGVV